MITSSRLYSLLWIIAFFGMVFCRLEFTNLKCISLDTQFEEFKDCYIKSVNRTYKYISIKAIFHKSPITNATIRFSMLKRLNGYKPFLYDFTHDVCKFMKNPSNPLIKYFYDFISQHSNINHTCPFDHDLILDKVPVSYFNHRLTKILPFPEGDYAFYTSWIFNGIYRSNVNIYFTLS